MSRNRFKMAQNIFQNEGVDLRFSKLRTFFGIDSNKLETDIEN